MPVISTTFWSLRSTTYALVLQPSITTCQGSPPTASSATSVSTGVSGLPV